jgi:hypothetical protein
MCILLSAADCIWFLLFPAQKCVWALLGCVCVWVIWVIWFGCSGRRGMHNVWSREGYWYKYLHPHFSTYHLLLTKLVNWWTCLIPQCSSHERSWYVGFSWVLELLSFVWQDTERIGVMLFLGDFFSDYYFWLAAAAALWKAELTFCVVLMIHHLSDAVNQAKATNKVGNFCQNRILETPLISVCCVCVWLMPHNPKLHCLQLSETCTPIVVRDRSCLWPCYGFPILSIFHNLSTPVSHGQLPWDIHDFCRASLLFQGMIVDWFSSTDCLTLLHRAGRHSTCNQRNRLFVFWYSTLVTGSMQSYDRALGMMDMWPADVVKRKRSKLDLDEQNDE